MSYIKIEDGGTNLSTGWRQCAELRALHRTEHSLRARLLSIEADALAVLNVHKALGTSLPIFGNARAGCWYVPQPGGVAAFKSCDGHYGTWAMSLRRPNLHVLHAALKHSGVVLIDATRSGKRYPDALSKTVPIWCAVITLLGVNHQPDDGVQLDDVLHLPPWVPTSEKSAIAALVPRWVSEWREAGVELPPELTGRRLRALWISTAEDRPLWEDGLPSAEELEFIPIVCISASAPAQGRKEVPGRMQEFTFDGVRFPTRTLSHPYVQGAGDDEENWARGLKPDVFWRNRERILGADDGAEGVVAIVDSVVHSESSDPVSLLSDITTSSLGESGIEVAMIEETKAHELAVAHSARYAAVLVFGVVAPTPTDADADADAENIPRNITYYPLRTHKGKPDTKHALCRALGPVLRSLRYVSRRGNSILLGAGANGADAATGCALAWLAWACESPPAPFNPVSRPRLRAEVSKQRVRAAMLAILSIRPELSISRAALLQVNRFFQSPNPPYDINTIQDCGTDGG